MAGRARLVDKDRGWKAFQKVVEELKRGGSYDLKVGVMGKSKYPDGTSVVDVAIFNEFGTKDAEGAVHTPERSFMRSTFNEQSEKMVAFAGKLMQRVILGRMDINTALNALGLALSTAIKKKITVDGVPPPNKQSTIDRKGSSRTLVDTARMLGAITWAVVKRKKST